MPVLIATKRNNFKLNQGRTAMNIIHSGPSSPVSGAAPAARWSIVNAGQDPTLFAGEVSVLVLSCIARGWLGQGRA